MPQAIYLKHPQQTKRLRVVLSDADVEAWIKSQPRSTNRGFLRRQFKATKDAPNYRVISGGRLVHVDTNVSLFI